MVKFKHPVNIMVLEAITSDGDVMLPFIFLQGLRFNVWGGGLHQVPAGSSAALDQESERSYV